MGWSWVDPQAAVKSRNALVVKTLRDGAQANASSKLMEDAADDLHPGLIDLAVFADRLAFAIGVILAPALRFSIRARIPRRTLSAWSLRNNAFIVSVILTKI
jgi:hypothetical protein